MIPSPFDIAFVPIVVLPSIIFNSSVVMSAPSSISSSVSFKTALPTVNPPPVIIPVVVIVEEPMSMDPKPLVIDPTFSVPTVLNVDKEVNVVLNNVIRELIVVNCSVEPSESRVKNVSLTVGVTLEYSDKSISTVTFPEFPPPLNPDPAVMIVGPPIENCVNVRSVEPTDIDPLVINTNDLFPLSSPLSMHVYVPCTTSLVES